MIELPREQVPKLLALHNALNELLAAAYQDAVAEEREACARLAGEILRRAWGRAAEPPDIEALIRARKP